MKMFEEILSRRKSLQQLETVPCALCGGEIYRGEYYYELDGKKVCRPCLERYAQRYFSHQRRRL